MICSVESCNKPKQKRQWCDVHYRRFMKYGDPLITKKRANGEGFNALGYIGYQINGVKKFEHVLVAEKALGKELPPGAVVHHVNEIKSDNRPENLVICPDRAYHNLIHARMRAMDACGDPNKRFCKYCKQYDDLNNLKKYVNGTSGIYFHPQCLTKNSQLKRERLKCLCS